MSVKVAVRVRPFNSRELELKNTCCVEMIGNTTKLTDPSTNQTRDFNFDFSFWSHDGFDTADNGYYVANSKRYADQHEVFNKVGLEILNNAWEGYHCCLFAYGQTGSGKSYSMVGYGTNKGIVPISCEEIFKRIKSNNNPDLNYEVQVSMLEIYNEKIQDLLVPLSKRPSGGLKVREHKKYGVYVEDQTKYAVDSYEAVEAKMEEGNQNRTIASTQMNACSSRAHTIISIEFKQKEEIEKRKTEKLSIINLVDLAGSEKVSKTGATGDRLKEGCMINKSLTVLGMVISSLAEKASGKKNAVVPYRDSVLTRILQNALGGNSKTLMICALSPATNNYEETLSTLRYADQAKKIKLHAVINESDQDKMIRELKEENEMLKLKLNNYNPKGPIIDEKTIEKIKEMEEQLKENAVFMQEFEKTFKQKLEEAKKKDKEKQEVDKSQPFMMNLNEDPFLTGKVVYTLKNSVTHVGKKDGKPTPTVVLGGIGIKSNHAIIKNENGKLFIEPFDKDCSEYIFVNGDRIHFKREINNSDRIIFGTNSTFLVRIPEQNQPDRAAKPDNKTEEKMGKEREASLDFDWEYAQNELMTKVDREKKIQEELMEIEREREVKKKMSLLEDQFKREKEETENLLKHQKLIYDVKLKELEQKMQKETEKHKIDAEKMEAERAMKENITRIEAERFQKELEREKQKKEIQMEENYQRFKRKEIQYMESKLKKYMPKILEVNLIAKELKRDITFTPKLTYFYTQPSDLETNQQEVSRKKLKKVQIQVLDSEENVLNLWTLSKFTDQYYLIKDVLDGYYESSQTNTIVANKDGDPDPFKDSAESHMIGQGYLKLLSLAYLLDNPQEIPLIGDNGQIGTLAVNVFPCNEKGDSLEESGECEEEEFCIEDPRELIGRRLDFIVKIDFAVLPEHLAKDTYVEFEIMTDEKTMGTIKSQTISGRNPNPIYNFKYHQTYMKITQNHLGYILNSNIFFKIYGIEDLKWKSAANMNVIENLTEMGEKLDAKTFKKIQKRKNQMHFASMEEGKLRSLQQNKTIGNDDLANNIKSPVTKTIKFEDQVPAKKLQFVGEVSQAMENLQTPDEKKATRVRHQSEAMSTNKLQLNKNVQKKEKDCGKEQKV